MCRHFKDKHLQADQSMIFHCPFSSSKVIFLFEQKRFFRSYHSSLFQTTLQRGKPPQEESSGPRAKAIMLCPQPLQLPVLQSPQMWPGCSSSPACTTHQNLRHNFRTAKILKVLMRLVATSKSRKLSLCNFPILGSNPHLRTAQQCILLILLMGSGCSVPPCCCRRCPEPCAQMDQHALNFRLHVASVN